MKQPEMTLWYDAPAPAIDDFAPYTFERRGWERFSLPLGNGRFGASVFGRLETERIQITENTLANPYATPKTAKRRGCCASGLNSFAEILIDINHSTAENYRRSLSLDDATASVSYRYRGVNYRRTAFVSAPDRVLAVRFEADRSGSISLGIHPFIPFLGEYNEEPGDGMGKSGAVTAAGDRLLLRGKMEWYGILYEGQLLAIPEAGRLCVSESGRIYVDGADAVTVLFTCATNYRLEPRVFSEPDHTRKLEGYPDPHDEVTRILDAAAALSWEELLRRHLEDYRKYYGRVTLSLGGQVPALPTDRLLEDYRRGKESRYLEELLFQYGRYLLIASSRDHLPANLQGIWNPYATSPWSAGYWHNINVQMNYWMSGPANLRELFLPYLRYAEAYLPTARANADRFVREYFPERAAPDGENGWIIGTSAFPYAISGFGKVLHSGPGTGAFTSLLFWDYYDYTGDVEFLRAFGYPALRGMALFFTRILEEIGGRMLVRESASPEQRQDGVHYHSTGCAFDQQMICENDRRTLEAAKILGIEEPLLDEIRRRLPLLDPVLIGESGQVKEYREETTYGSIGDPHHRHISHLVGLYPATVINETTPEWMAAARITLDGRGDQSTGWATAHRLCLRARAKCSAKAMTLIRSLFANNIMENLWDTHPPFQIDGNFGYTAGVCEMLLQSQAGYLELLPCLPEEWRSGSFSGLLARGGFAVSASWENGHITAATVVSECGNLLRLRLPEGVTYQTPGGRVTDGILEIRTEKNQTIALRRE